MKEFYLDELSIEDDASAGKSFYLDELSIEDNKDQHAVSASKSDENGKQQEYLLSDLRVEEGADDAEQEKADEPPVMISPGLMSGGGAMIFSQRKKDSGNDGKVERSKDDLMRLRWQAETGQKDGAFRYGFSAVPFVGGSFKEEQKDKLSRMKAFADGKPQLRGRVVDGRTVTPQEAAEAEVMTSATMGIQPDETVLDEMWSDEAQHLGISQADSKRKEGESRFDYRTRLKNLVNDSLKESVGNIQEAKRDLQNTHETMTDTIVVEGIPSLGYMGEMATGGWMFRGGQGLKLGFDLLSKAGLKQLLTKEGAKQFGKFSAKKVAHDSLKAAPATVAGAERGVRELSRDEYGFDKNGDVVVTAEGDKGNVGGKALLNSYTENLLENLVGEVTRPVAGKLFGLIGKTGKVGKFVNDAYKNYNRICDITSFGDIVFEELPEENVQYFFSDVLGWGKKDSEYRGVFKELKHAFTDEGGQYTLGGQWNTVFAMLMQMGGQAAIAGIKTGKQRIDEKRDIGSILEGIGLTKEQVAKMPLGERNAYARLYSKWSKDPAAFEDALRLAGGFIGEHAEELMKQSTYKTENSIREYGETPRGFKFQYRTDEGGKQVPVFEKELHTDPLTGEQSFRDVMTDVESGVSIADNGDGTYSVSDGMRQGWNYETDDFNEAKRFANFYALKAQRNRLDNDRKREYARQLLSTKFKRNAIVADHVSNIYQMFKNEIEMNGNCRGVTDLGQLFRTDNNGNVAYPLELKGGNATGGFACPDGSIAMILDNIAEPRDMVRLLSHESGHVSGYGDAGKRLSFLKKADPNSEYGRMLTLLRAINDVRKNGGAEIDPNSEQGRLLNMLRAVDEIRKNVPQEDGIDPESEDGRRKMILNILNAIEQFGRGWSEKDREFAKSLVMAEGNPGSEYGRRLGLLRLVDKSSRKWTDEDRQREAARVKDDDYLLGEAFSVWIQQRGHNPSIMQKLHNVTLGKFGRVGDAELEVLANQIERESESGTDHSMDADDRVSFVSGVSFESVHPNDEGGEPPAPPPAGGESGAAPSADVQPPAEGGEGGSPTQPTETSESDSAKQELARAEQELEQAKRGLEYAKNLFGSSQDVRAARQEVENAQKRVNEIRGRIENGNRIGIPQAEEERLGALGFKRDERGKMVYHDKELDIRVEITERNPDGTYTYDHSGYGEIGVGTASNSTIESIKKFIADRKEDVKVKRKIANADRQDEEDLKSNPESFDGEKLLGLGAEDVGDGVYKIKYTTPYGGKRIMFISENDDKDSLYRYKTSTYHENGHRTTDISSFARLKSEFDARNVRKNGGTPTPAPVTPAEPPAGDEGETAPAVAETPAEGDSVVPTLNPNEKSEKKPITDRTIIEKLTDEVKPDEVAIDEIEVSDSRIPQFKEGADPTTGEVEPLTGEPYDLVSNPIVVMEFKDGKKVVVTGRHRYGLYRRAGRKTISARVIREADGWTVGDAMAIDAIGNIIDEKGTEKDYVRYFDEAKPTREKAEAIGLLDREKGRRAFGIFEGGTEDTKALIDWEGTGADGKISVAQAGIIAEAAPKDAHPRFQAVQKVLARKALAGVSGTKLGILARSLAEEAKNRKGTPRVEGEMQLDLFTSEEDLALLAMEEKRADYRAKKASEYRRIAEVLRTAIRKGGKLDLNAQFAKELGITDPKDKAQLTKAWQKATERANYWENTPALDAADKSAMDADIEVRADAAAKKVADAKAKRDAKTAGKPEKSVNATEKTGEKPKSSNEKPKSAEKMPKSENDAEKQKEEKQKPDDLQLESVTAEQLSDEKRRQQERDAVKAGIEKPIKGSGEVNVQPEMDLGQTGQTDLFSPIVPNKPAPAPKTIVMKNAAEEAKAAKLLDEIDFDDKAFEENGNRRSGASSRIVKDLAPVDRVAIRDFLLNGKAPKIEIESFRRARLDGENIFQAAARMFAAPKNYNTPIGVVMIDSKGVNNSLGHKFRKQKLDVLPTLLEDFKEAKYLGSLKDLDGAPVMNHYFAYPMEYSDGKRYIVFCRIKETKENRRLHIHEVGTIDEINEAMPIKPRALNSEEDHFPRGIALYKSILKEILDVNPVAGENTTGGDGKVISAKARDVDFDDASLLGKVAGAYLKWLDKFRLGHTDKRLKEWKKIRRPIDFDDTAFDYEKFGKLVSGVGKLVDVMTANGHNTFESLATYIAERDAAKYERAKAVLQDVWNAVARQKNLVRIPDSMASTIYDKIDAKLKEVSNGLQSGDADGSGGGALAGTSSENDAETSQGKETGTKGVSGREDGSGDGVPGAVGSGAGFGVGNGPRGLHPAAGGGGRGGRPGQGGGNPRASGGTDRGAVSGRSEVDHAPVAGDGTHVPEGGGSNGLDAGHGLKPSVKKAASKAANKTTKEFSDFVMTPSVEEAILERNQIKRVRNNIAAIKLLQELKKRDFKATPEEQNVLAKYVGWGGLSEIFTHEYDRAYDFEKMGDAEAARKYASKGKYGLEGYEAYKELRQTLNDEEYRAAKATVLTAFYTPIEMVRIEHEALRRLGVLGGRFLGPSAGVGNYASAAGLYEKDVAWQFVEKDIVSGQILKALFPNQRVHIGGYEETKFADSFFDFAIDNVPYGDINITDKSLMKAPLKIHDYFFAKTLSKLRPGGVMMFLTSTGTLDKTDGKLRQFLSQNGGKIIGAVRLPNGFFSKNAGTDVASDLVIIQRQEGEADNSGFMQSVKYGEGSEYVRRKGSVKVDLTYNKYFADHPAQIVGEMKVGSGQYGRTILEYKMPKDGMFDLVRDAIDHALAGVDKDALMKNAPKAVQKDHTPIYDSEGLRQGNITVKDGVVYEKSGDELEAVKISLDDKKKKAIAIKGLTPVKVVEKILEVRKALRDVVDAEVKGVDDETLQPLLDKLNAVYDAFVKKCGTFHDNAITPLVMLDKADGNRLMSLENARKVDGKNVLEKADIFKKRVIFTHARPTKADTIDDALVISYSETATVDTRRIGELLGVSAEEAEKRLKDSGKAFENPQTGKIEPYWEYLSGHVRKKLEAARAATANDPSFRKNVEELEKVQPKDVSLDEVNIKFGATWVDTEAMVDFIREAYDLGEYATVKLEYNETTGKWDVGIPRSDIEPFGATTFSQEHFLSSILNHKSLEVKEKDDATGKYYLLEKETEAQKLAAEKLHEAFARFLRTSEKWFEPSGKSFNYIMNDNVPMVLPKNILPLRPAGMSEEAIRKISAEGREYQPDVIARGVMGGKSLCLAHCVGAGKTLEMQTIGMVGRHLGMFKKPMYVVPNHMLDQFCNEFIAAFPNANLLKMSTDDVNPKNRRAFFAKVANGDWDAIVVKHSTFSQKLPMTKAWQKQYLEKQVQELADAKLAAKGDKGTVKDIEAIIKKVEAKIGKLDNSDKKDEQIVPFEELGVDQLFIDEAHNFKGLPIVSSQARNVKGLDQGNSQRALDMEMKALYVQSLHGGKRGVVFATGTPLSNAPVVEAYGMLRFLAPYALEEQGIRHFDDFVNTFGSITTESEFGIDGKTTKEVSRITSFVNIPEMMRLFRSVVDIVNSDQIKVKRPKEKLIPVPVKMDDAQAKVMGMVARESAVPASKEERGKFLTLSGIAKRACISPRLVGIDSDGNKLAACAENIKREYDETSDVRGAQLVFTDIFNSSDAKGIKKYVGGIEGLNHSSSSWNLNKHLKELLVKSGIPADQIAIIQDVDKVSGDDEAKSAAKEELFAKVRSGEIRVLIGSRPRMGEGTNVQERLAAIHFLHPGWKPSEDEQSKGRGRRPGNMFETCKMYYYLTQGNEEVGSYETKNHELIGVKDRLIQAVMHGDDTIREIDLDEESAERDLLMGLASANQDLIKLIDVRRVLHKAELNIESVLFSARSNEDNASRTERGLERAKESFKEQEAGAKKWREKNPNGSFVLTTADGREIEKVSEMADYISGEVTKQLAKERYRRDDALEIGNFNGVPLNVNYSYGENKFAISIPSIGASREIAYSGFIPDFSTMAMTAFKTRVLNETSEDIEAVHAQQVKDTEKRIKRLRDDAKRFTEEYNKEKEKLISLRKERERLERSVAPLIVQTTEDHKYVTYGNWYISKVGNNYHAKRASDEAELTARTVKELIPMMDEADFGKPGAGVNKTIDLKSKLERRGVESAISSVKPKDVDFDDRAFDESEEYKSVVAKYRGTPQWMKAPNGKPTNLTERQWVQVRTSAFKDWFGDWQGNDLRMFLESTPLRKVSIVDVPDGGYAPIRKWAREIFASFGGVVENSVLGKVLLDAESVNDSLGHGKLNIYKNAAFKSVKDVIEKGRIVHIGEKDGVPAYYIAAPIEIDGVPNVVVALVKKHPNKNRFYLHSVGTKESLRRHGVSRSIGRNLSNPSSNVNEDYLIVLNSAFAVNPASVSKIVDENGEPRVMYHGDRVGVGGYSIFDMRYARSNDVTQSRGFYFTNSKAYAEGFGGDVREFFLNIRNPYEGKRSDANIDNGEFDYYSANLDRIERANEYVLENISSAINEMEEFIRDGIDGDESLEDALDKSVDYQYLIGLKEGLWFLDQSNYTDFVNDILSQYNLGKFGKDIIDILGLNEEDEAHVFTAWLRGNYYDGQIDDQISGYEKGIEQIIVLDPNQIKSATDNAGTFDSKNPRIDFDDTALRPDPTPEEVDKLVGITNEDIDLRTKALGLKPSPHEVVGFDHMHRQAEILLSNPEYMKKLIRAVYKWDNGGRGVAPHENLAIGQFFTALSNEIEADKAYLDEIKGMIDSGDVTDEEMINEYKRERAKFDKKLALHAMTEIAKKKGVGNAARTLLSNRDMLRPDLSFAGIVSKLSEAYGLSVENGIQLPPEVMKAAEELAEEFKKLSADEVAFYARRVREYSKKVFADHAKKVKTRVATANSNDAAIVTRNYLDAMTQIEVAAGNGDVDLLGLQDNTIPGFGKWLKAIAEYHIMTNPDITADPETAEEKVVAAIVEDVKRFLPEVTADMVRRAYTGYGHHFKQSNRETQAIVNDLRGQSLSKLQLKTMQEENKLPPITGMERDEPSDVRRRLMKDVYEAKKLTPEGAESSLKGVLQSAKKALDNRIKDLQHAIDTKTALPKRERRVWDDVEIIKKRAELEELKKKYDEIFKTTRVLTDEERVKMAEKAMGRVLEKLTNEVIAARQGMFKNGQKSTVTSSTLEVLRQKANEMRKELLDLKKAAYYHGKTPAEIMALNRRKIENLRKLIEKKADWVRDGKRPAKSDPLPMTKNQKAEYERLAKANREANEKLRQMEEDARRMTWVAPARTVVDTWNFLAGNVQTVAASVDRSAVLRQTLTLSLAHPAMAAKHYAIAEKAAWNGEYFERVNEEIMNDPVIAEATEKFGLKIRSSDIANVHDVEQFATKRTLAPRYIKRMGDLLGEIPGVGTAGRAVNNVKEFAIENSERHYITYINLMAAMQYKLFCDAVPGGATDFEKRKFAGAVNILTGAGSAPGRLRSAINTFLTANGTINSVIWSPSLMMSQIQQLLFADVWGAFIGHSQDAQNAARERTIVAKETAKLRIRALLSLAFLGFMIIFLFSSDDEWEEFKNADFLGKIDKLYHPVIGNTHIDLQMGERSFAKAMSQLFKAEYETSTGRKVKVGDFGYRDIYSTFGRYLGGKLSPAYSRAISLFQGRDFVGKPYGLKQAAIESVLPLSLGDIYDSAVQNEWWNGQAEVAIALTLLGAGGNVYEEKYFERAVNPMKSVIREYDKIAEDVSLDVKERREIMSKMKEDNPILSAGNRYWFVERMKTISQKSRTASDNEMRGKPDEKLLEEIEKEKRELMEFVRKVKR